MKRRTLDVLFSAGGIALAGLLLVLGLVMTSNANFAKGYVKDQLSQQNITFTTRDALTDEEQQSACLVKYAGQPLTTGKQAECYANDFIGLHLKSTADGQTYADLGAPQSDLRAEVAAAQTANDPALPDLQKQLTDHHGAARHPVQGRDPPRAAAHLVRVQRLRREGRAGRNGGLHRRRAAGAAVDRRLRPCVQDPEGQGLRGASP